MTALQHKTKWKTLKTLGFASALAILVLTGQGAVAATQGTLGATSTGTVGVSLAINAIYQVSSLSDFALGVYPGSGAMTANQDVCVYSNDASRNYHVRVTDSSTMSGSAFSVQNASNSAHIPYSLKWNDKTGTNGNANINYGSALYAGSANATSPTCSSGGKSANLQISMTSNDLLAAPAGTYSTTISLIVEP